MKLTIEWIYQSKKGIKANFSSEALPAAQALALVEDMEQTGRIQKLTLIDEHDSSWTIKELRRYFKELQTEPHAARVYFDGGFHQATKTAGLGVVIYYEQNNEAWRKRFNAEMTGLNSNNEAEYAALHASVTELLLMGVHHQTVEFFGDSQVVIQQMAGEWAVYEQELASWAEKIDQLLAGAGLQARYEHIPRKQNEEAHQLATQALTGTMIDAQKK